MVNIKVPTDHDYFQTAQGIAVLLSPMLSGVEGTISIDVRRQQRGRTSRVMRVRFVYIGGNLSPAETHMLRGELPYNSPELAARQMASIIQCAAIPQPQSLSHQPAATALPA
jgi:hypothetical protein